MKTAQDRGRLDWLVELSGAAAPAGATMVAAAWLAPTYGLATPVAVLIGGLSAFAAAYAAMRAVPAEPRQLALPDFAQAPIAEKLLLDERLDELLLDQPLLEDSVEAVAELLLDDPLPVAAPDSRVVQLFADGRMPSAGQLRSRIDRHLAEGGRTEAAADASDALSEALAELRRSLRQG